MNNTVGERAIACEEFAKNLERRTGLEVIMWDERLTTVSAEKALMESGVRRENRKAVIDQIAAVLYYKVILTVRLMQQVNELIKVVIINMEKLTFVTDDNENVELYIIEETRANGVNYLLVTDSSDEEDTDAECYILKDTSSEADADAVYEFVEDDTEFDAISRIFAELMDDDIELI